jgi:hypothetical protein
VLLINLETGSGHSTPNFPPAPPHRYLGWFAVFAHQRQLRPKTYAWRDKARVRKADTSVGGAQLQLRPANARAAHDQAVVDRHLQRPLQVAGPCDDPRPAQNDQWLTRDLHESTVSRRG